MTTLLTATATGDSTDFDDIGDTVGSKDIGDTDDKLGKR